MWVLAPLLLAASPPPGCRAVTTAQNTTDYECVLCQSTPPRLRPHTRYLLNAACDLNTPRPGVVAPPSAILATDGVEIQPLDDANLAQLYGTIHVIGSGVQIHDISLSHRIEVTVATATDLQIRDVVVTEDSLGFSISPPSNSHDANVNNLQIQNLVVPQRKSRTVATLYHAVGDINVECGPDQTDRVVVQPMVPVGDSHMPNCQVVNMSAIFDALGSAVATRV